MIVVLGNRSATHAVPGLEPDAKRATTIEFPDEWTIAQCFRALTDGDGIVANHFTEGTGPVWVASENAVLADLISENFDGIEVRELETADNSDSDAGSVAP